MKNYNLFGDLNKIFLGGDFFEFKFIDGERNYIRILSFDSINRIRQHYNNLVYEYEYNNLMNLPIDELEEKIDKLGFILKTIRPANLNNYSTK